MRRIETHIALLEAARALGVELLVLKDRELAILPAGGWLAGPAPADLRASWAGALGQSGFDLVWLPTASWQVCLELGRHGGPLYEARPGRWREFKIAAHLRGEAWHLEGGHPLDMDLLRRKATALGQYLEALELTLGPGPQDFQATTARYAAERLIELLVETAAFINTEVTQSVGDIALADYDASFLSLERKGWIEPATAQALAECARLRNVLAHHNEDLAPSERYGPIRGSLPHWRRYLEAIQVRTAS